MKPITNETIDRGVTMLDEHLKHGDTLEHDGVYWILYAVNGAVTESGKDIRELITNLALKNV